MIVEDAPEGWKLYSNALMRVFSACNLKWIPSQVDQDCVWAEPKVEQAHNMWTESEYPKQMEFSEFLMRTLGPTGTNDAVSGSTNSQ